MVQRRSYPSCTKDNRTLFVLTHPRDNEDARGHWLFKMTFTNTIGMAALFLSVQRTPTSKPPP